MSRCVAFEGPDLTGKTSLIAALQALMPYAMWPLLVGCSSSLSMFVSRSGQPSKR